MNMPPDNPMNLPPHLHPARHVFCGGKRSAAQNCPGSVEGHPKWQCGQVTEHEKTLLKIP